VQSHFEGEAWGLEILDDGQVVTCGDDNRVMLFDSIKRQYVRGGKISDKKMKDPTKKSMASTVSQMPPNKQARTVAVSKTHSHLVVCSNMGKVSIRSFDDFDKKVGSLKEAKHWCQVAKYSPNEDYLAIGSHDNHVYIYHIDPVTHEYKLYAKDARNHAWITAIDWTCDNKEIRTSSGDYEVLYFNVEAMSGDDHGS
jgi:microtubule-associated protein-like 1/2